MNYTEALEYIHSINWTFCKPGLERIKELCQKLGNPQDDLKFIHVAGTNGKGSFCSMLDSVLRAAGYKITMEPTDIVIGSTPPYPARIAFCIGPVGEELEFFCEK